MDNIAKGLTGLDCYAGLMEAWHGKGQVRPEGFANSTEALDAADANYVMGKDNFYIHHNGTFRKVGGGWAALVRKDTGTVFGVVKKRYQVLQNADAFKTLDVLVSNGVAKILTCGAIREGARAWMQVEFTLPPDVMAALGDGIRPRGLVSVDHAAKQRVIVQCADQVVVCANTIAIAQNEFFSGSAKGIALRHDTGVGNKLDRAVETLWGDIVRDHGIAAQQYALMKKTALTVEEFNAAVLDSILAIPAKLSVPVSKREQTSRGKLDDKRAALTDLWDGNAKGIDDTTSRTAWAGYMAVTESIQHDDKLWRAQGFRDASVMFGRLAQAQDVVLENLVDLCVAKSSDSLVDRMVERSPDAGGGNLLDAIIA